MFRMHGQNGKLLNAAKSFYNNSKACVRVNDKLIE